MMDAAFTGYTALPESTNIRVDESRQWYDILEVSPTAGRPVIDAAYKAMLFKVHPDHGGSNAAFMELQQAYKEAINAT